MNFSRTQLRKQPVLEALHEFMKRENETGSITRQEAVSMVPPLFMDVEPHHWVLDMCAAPGSKTFQLLEMLHAGPAPPTGLVVANDADAMRCNLLCHQTKRMCSPHLVVTHHEAQGFPLLRDLDPASPDTHVLFDRILCDVPCSGDGTMRKAPDIWHRWSTASGNGLHGLQLRIALRAFQLLRVGGRLVYSTCTFNPVEDEAVVAELLRRTAGALELVDCSDALPGLRRMPGKQRWRVRDRQRWYDTWEEGKQVRGAGGGRRGARSAPCAVASLILPPPVLLVFALSTIFPPKATCPPIHPQPAGHQAGPHHVPGCRVGRAAAAPLHALPAPPPKHRRLLCGGAAQGGRAAEPAAPGRQGAARRWEGRQRAQGGRGAGRWGRRCSWSNAPAGGTGGSCARGGRQRG
jgi:16S rRNA C967 or C1407 C5-methylase (RsmB/RsmF family)